MSELRKIPNVGETTEQDLIAMGYTTIESLKGKSADEWSAACFPCNAPDVGKLKGKSFGCNIRAMTAAVCMIAV